MNKLLVIFIIFCFPFVGYSQKEGKSYRRYFAKDQFSFSLNNTQLIKSTNEVNLSVFSRGVNLQMMYPIIGNNSNVAIAIGFGYAGQNYYLKEYISFNNDSIWFKSIPDSVDYKKYKLSTNYLTVPFELRFRTNPNKTNRKSFKIYPGFRLGMMVNVHTKYIGDDMLTHEKIKEKQYDQKHINLIDYGPTLRIGYGKFMVNGYFSLSDLIAKGKGPVLTPVEIGVSVILF